MSEYLRTTFNKFELRVRKGFYYITDDLWVSIENGEARVGVSDYLQKTSGNVAFIEVAKPSSLCSRVLSAIHTKRGFAEVPRLQKVWTMTHRWHV